ncbi:MAG TPA: hypothetical protein VF203_05140, partial [Burkholderiales bacterium]
MSLILRTVVGAALAIGALGAAAQENRPVAKQASGVENAVAICAGCHGIEGYKTAFPTVYHVPRIGGQRPT